MKKIIKGKVYSTESARKIGSWASSEDCGNLDYFEETLYQKRTGEFFIHGEGGARTRYAAQTGQNTWKGGEAILPIGYDDARAWAEEHLTAEEYQGAFGAIVEDGSRSTVLLSLPVSKIEQIKREAAQAGMSLSAYVESKL